MKILLMEDDLILGEIVTEFLEAYYSVDRVFDGLEAKRFILEKPYDLYIFDINVPGINGIELIKELRELDNTTPVLIISANHDTCSLKKSFDAGAHDYIRKPFQLEELRLRIEKSCTLFNIRQNIPVKITEQLTYFPKSRVVSDGTSEITFRPKELELLEYFISNPGRWISIHELSVNLWNYTDIPSDATLRSYIRKLRNIIGKEKITTQRGLGYRYETS